MAGGQKMTVLNPMGYPPRVTHKPLAPRLDTLNGKTVYLVDCRFDDADIFLKQMQAWFAEHMPSVRTVFRLLSVFRDAAMIRQNQSSLVAQSDPNLDQEMM